MVCGMKNDRFKFRAWDVRANKMYQVKSLGMGECEYERHAHNYLTEPKTGYCKNYPRFVRIMQFTGLQDSKGVDIYEGDVVKCGNGDTGPVIWNESGACFDIEGYWESSADSPGYAFSEGETFEVIGNVHDNPELTDKTVIPNYQGWM